MTGGSAVIAFRPLVGVASDRFFDGARLIRQNLDFIASQAVGYLTSTDYKNLLSKLLMPVELQQIHKIVEMTSKIFTEQSATTSQEVVTLSV